MKRFAFLLIITLFLLSCTEKSAKNNEPIVLDSLKREELKITIINDSAQTNHITDNHTSFWVPTQNQLDTIDSILEKAITDNYKSYYRHLKPNTFKSYYRQYVTYTEANGDSIVFINAFLKNNFCPLPGDNVRKRDDWQYYLIKAKDGGDSFWHVTINLTQRRYFYFIVNGVA